jgi:hypothetical protein
MAQKNIDPARIKSESEQRILALGGRVCDWLPFRDPSRPRTTEETIGRTLIVNAMLQIYFQAPTTVIADWIEANGSDAGLTSWERTILSQDNDQLADQDRTNLYWYIEALWALAWIGSLIPDLDVIEPVGDHLASLMPNLQRGESASQLRQTMRIRPFPELYRMLDFYDRAHWYARDGQLNGYGTGRFSLDVIMERRRALEWAIDRSADWDDYPQDT